MVALANDADFGSGSSVKIEPRELTNLANDCVTWVTVCIADGSHQGKALETITLAMPFNEPRQKQTALASVGARFYSERKAPLAVVMSVEAYAAQNPPKGVQPMHCPNRREILLIAWVAIGLKPVMTSAPITRDEHGIIQTLTFEPIKTEGVSWPLLDYFFFGFASGLSQHKAT